MKITFNNLKIPLLLWGILTLFFALQFILRLTVGILREDILIKYQIDTMLFASLAGFYYLGYAGFQIPIGILLDKFNSKNVAVFFMLVTSFGTIIFVKAYSYPILLLGRFLIAVGSASAFLSIVKVTNNFFPREYHSMMLGLSFAIGLAGAVFGGNPTKYIFDKIGYEVSLMYLAIFIAMMSMATFLINEKKAIRLDLKEAKKLNLKRFVQLITNKYIMSIGVLGGLMVGSLEGFADLWAIPFLSSTQGLIHEQSIFMASCVYIGMCCGGPLLAYVNQYFKAITNLIALTGIFTCIIFALLFKYQLNVYVIVVLMFFMGILCCYQLLVFIFAENFVEKSLIGATIAIINCVNMSFGWLFHKLIAILLLYRVQNNQAVENLVLHSQGDYFFALSIVPILSLVGSLGFLILGYFYYRSNRHNRMYDIKY